MAGIYYSLTICSDLYAKQLKDPSACPEEIIAYSNNHSTIQK